MIMPDGSASPHSDTCSSVIARSAYDTSCPRCAIINKVVMLRRKRVAFGCSSSEQSSAESAAQAIISRYQLAHVECIDRLYVRERAIASGERPKPRSRSSAMNKAAWRASNWRKTGLVVNQDEGVIICDV